jgi:hypothetical protein
MSQISLLAAENEARVQTIRVFKGENVTLNFTVTPDTSIVGWTIVMTVRKSLESADEVLTKTATLDDAANGEFSFDLNTVDTELLTEGPYLYDVTRTDTGFITTLGIGSFILKGSSRLP